MMIINRSEHERRETKRGEINDFLTEQLESCLSVAEWIFSLAQIFSIVVFLHFTQCQNCLSLFVHTPLILDLVVLVIVDLLVLVQERDCSWWVGCRFANQLSLVALFLTDFWAFGRENWTEADLKKHCLADFAANAVAGLANVATTILFLHLKNGQICAPMKKKTVSSSIIHFIMYSLENELL
jgi:hypothetical protein